MSDRFVRTCLLLVGMGALLSACDDRPFAPSIEPNSATVPTEGDETQRRSNADIHERGPTPRFDLEIDVQGQPTIDQPFAIIVRARAGVGSDNTRVRLVLPELEISARNGGRFDGDDGRALQGALDKRDGLASGVTNTEAVVVTIADAGYWRIAASVLADGPSDEVIDGQWLSNVAHRQAWIYIDENGSVVTEEFDPSALPDSVIAVPGPRRLRPVAAGPAASAAATASVEGPARAVQNSVFTVQYYDTDSVSYIPVPDVKIEGIYYENGLPFFSSSSTVDGNGNVTLQCNTDYDYSGNVVFSGHGLSMGMDQQITFYGCSAGWNNPSVIVTTQLRSRSWMNFLPSLDNAATMFSQSRSTIPVTISSSTSCNAFYSPGQDKITICQPAVWGEYGRFVAPHEYGHAFHEKALGGNEGSGTCSGDHYVFATNNMQCAFSEGFADFFAAITAQEAIDNASRWEDDFERPTYQKLIRYALPDELWCKTSTPCPYSSQRTLDGGQVEGALAAFLYDLADNATTENHQPTSDDEGISYGPQYVADVYEKCEVRQGSTWIRANGFDHLVYCFERRLSNYAAQGYWPTRSIDPNNWRTTALSLPSGWNANTIKSTWQGIAFADGPPVSPLTAFIAGPSEVSPYEQCTWQVFASGGIPPYTYNWYGALSGTNSFVSGSVGSNSTLYVSVTSSDSQSTTPSFWIMVDTEADECLE